jgi:mannose-6-phosphate isomerase-like protein (cupin superfamily)
MMKFDIEGFAELFPQYRRILWTGAGLQLVLMTIPPGDEIGLETHELSDQLFSFVSGAGKTVVDGDESTVGKGDVVAVPAGAEHNIINDGDDPLVLFTVYGPPVHAADEPPEDLPPDEVPD